MVSNGVQEQNACNDNAMPMKDGLPVGKTRIAPSKDSLLNVLICAIGTEDDLNITRYTSTGKRYTSIHSFYTSMHDSDTRRNKRGGSVDEPSASCAVENNTFT